MIKKAALFFASLFVGAGLFIWAASLIGWNEIRSAFLIFAGWHGIVILLLTFLILFIGMWKWKVILKSQGHDLPLLRLIAPYFSGFSLIYLFPLLVLGGEIFKAALLKDKYKVPWKCGITSIIIDKILEATFFVLAVFAGIIFFLLRIGLPPKNLGLVVVAFLLLSSLAIGFFYLKVFKRQSIIKLLSKFINHERLMDDDVLEAERAIFVFFKSDRRALFQASFLAFLRVAATWLRCWILVLFLGKSISFLSVLPILGFYYIAFMVPIPAALGSHELVQIFAFDAVGLGSSLAPAFTMIQRGAELILAFAGLAAFFKLGIGLLRSLLFKKIDNLVR